MCWGTFCSSTSDNDDPDTVEALIIVKATRMASRDWNDFMLIPSFLLRSQFVNDDVKIKSDGVESYRIE